jgi:hypothetical protein
VNPMVNATTRELLASRSATELSTSAGLIVFGLLLAILLSRELLRVLGGDDVERRLRVLDVAAAPLLVSLAVVLGARFWEAL